MARWKGGRGPRIGPVAPGPLRRNMVAMASALLIAVLAAGAPLFALGSETWWGLAPCELCLWQRWPYWAAAALAALGVLVPARARAVLVGLAGLAALASAGIGALHVGVEQGWWPSPLPGCAAPTAGRRAPASTT